jgi:hypothetical protein
MLTGLAPCAFTVSILAYRRVEDAGGIAVNPWPLEEIFQ